MLTVATGLVLAAAIIGGSAHAKDMSPQQNTAWQQVYSCSRTPAASTAIRRRTTLSRAMTGTAFANVVRGMAGDGVPALQCVTCHQRATP